MVVCDVACGWRAFAMDLRCPRSASAHPELHADRQPRALSCGVIRAMPGLGSGLRWPLAHPMSPKGNGGARSLPGVSWIAASVLCSWNDRPHMHLVLNILFVFLI